MGCLVPLVLLVTVLLALPDGGVSCPHPCACYQPTEVHCTFRSLLTVPRGLPKHVQRINFGFNTINRITESSFAGLRKLELLMLHGNDLHNVPNAAFRDLASLQVLKMSYNKVQRIMRHTLLGLSGLVRLHLDHNRIELIHPDAFQGMTSLRLLQLEGNRLQQLHPSTFATFSILQSFHVSTIKHLYLSDNSLTMLPPQMLKSMSQLESLFLHGNPWACDCRLHWFPEWTTHSPGVLKCKKDKSYPRGQLCSLCSSPEHLRNKDISELKEFTCAGPRVISPNKEDAVEDEDTEVLTTLHFRAAFGNITLNLTDEHGHKVDLDCSINGLQEPTKVTWDTTSSEQISVNVSLFLDVECPVDQERYAKLWNLIAYYSEAPMQLQRDLMLNKEPRLSYRYRQEIGTHGYHYTGVCADVLSQPTWLMHSTVKLQLNRPQSTSKGVKLILSTRFSQTLETEAMRGQSRKWVVIEYKNDTRTTVTTVTGSVAEMDCRVLSSGSPLIHWVLPDSSKLIAPYNSVDNRVSLSSTGKLVIKAVTLSDSGLYYCIAEVKEDLDVLAFRLFVEESSKPLSGNKSGLPVKKFVGESVSFPCVATATPNADFSWVLPNGDVINSRVNSSRAVVYLNGSIFLYQTQPTDSGYYKCVAANQYGMDSLATKLILTRRYEPRLLRKYPMRPQSASGISTKIKASIDDTEESSGDGTQETALSRHMNKLSQRGQKNNFRGKMLLNAGRYPYRRRKPVDKGAHEEKEKGSPEVRRKVNVPNKKIDPKQWADILAKIRNKAVPKTTTPSSVQSTTSANVKLAKTTPTLHQEHSESQRSSQGPFIDDANLQEEGLYLVTTPIPQEDHAHRDSAGSVDQIKNMYQIPVPKLDLHADVVTSTSNIIQPTSAPQLSGLIVPDVSASSEGDDNTSALETTSTLYNTFSQESEITAYNITDYNLLLKSFSPQEPEISGTRSSSGVSSAHVNSEGDVHSYVKANNLLSVTTAKSETSFSTMKPTSGGKANQNKNTKARNKLGSRRRLGGNRRLIRFRTRPDNAKPLSTVHPKLATVHPKLVSSSTVRLSQFTEYSSEKVFMSTSRTKPQLQTEPSSVEAVTLPTTPSPTTEHLDVHKVSPKIVTWTEVRASEHHSKTNSMSSVMLQESGPSTHLSHFSTTVQNQKVDENVTPTASPLTSTHIVFEAVAVTPSQKDFNSISPLAGSSFQEDNNKNIALEITALPHLSLQYPHTQTVSPPEKLLSAINTRHESQDSEEMPDNENLLIYKGHAKTSKSEEVHEENESLLPFHIPTKNPLRPGGSEQGFSLEEKTLVTTKPSVVLTWNQEPNLGYDDLNKRRLEKSTNAATTIKSGLETSTAVALTTATASLQQAPNKFMTDSHHNRVDADSSHSSEINRDKYIPSRHGERIYGTNHRYPVDLNIRNPVIISRYNVVRTPDEISPHVTNTISPVVSKAYSINSAKPTTEKLEIDTHITKVPFNHRSMTTVVPTTAKTPSSKESTTKVWHKAFHVTEAVRNVSHYHKQPSLVPSQRTRPRIITTNLHTVSVYPDTDALLACDTVGEPKPLLTWTKISTGAVMTVNNKVPRFEVMANGTFVIRKAQLYDRGQYLCTAQNPYGVDKMLVTLIVLAQQPKMLQPYYRDVTVYLGNSTIMDCRATGLPAPNITWMLPDRTTLRSVTTSQQRVMLLDNGTLHIQSVAYPDRGIYKCIASNAAGFDILSVRLHITALPPIIQQQRQENFTLFEGQAVHMHCSAKGAPLPSIRWLITDGTQVRPSQFVNGNVFVFPNGTLYIRNLLPRDSGRYECAATSAVGASKRAVNLLVQKAVSTARITSSSPKWTHVTYGGHLYLDCVATGDPGPRVVWRIPSKKLVDVHYSFDPRIKVFGNGTLTVQAVTEKDEGDYLCVARNKMGDDYVLLKVSIMMRPAKIEHKQLANQKVSYGAALKVDCVASGVPNPDIRWSLPDGTMVNSAMQSDDSGLRTRRFEVFNNGTLYFNDVGMKEEGDYTCYAENKIGRDEMKIHVKVVVDSPVIRNKTYDIFQVPYGESVSLLCGAKGEPPPSISWRSPTNYIIPPKSDKYQVHNDGTLVVRKVQRYDRGNYTCTARNAAGQDKKVVGVEVLISAPTINGRKGVVSSIHETAFRDQRKLLDCKAEGIPVPQVVWVLPGNVVLPTRYYGSRMKVHHNGTLDIQSLKKSDSVQLVCIARNEGGEAKLTVHMDVKDIVEKPLLKSPKTEHNFFTVGTIVTLNCSVEGHPAPQITWTLPMGSSLQSRAKLSRFFHHPDGTLHINSSMESDAGKYQCMARNPAGHVKRTVTLELKKKPTVGSKHGPVVSIISGENLQLHCLSSSDSAATLSWTLPSGIVLTKPQRAGRYAVLPNGTLTVQQASVYDRGAYTCKSESELGSSLLTVPVIVIAYPPRVTSGPAPVTYARPGVAIQLNCMAIGIPRAEVVWELPDKMQLTARSQPKLFSNKYLLPQGSLIIQNPSSRDTGYYKCIAKNIIGSDTKTTYVHVF